MTMTPKEFAEAMEAAAKFYEADVEIGHSSGDHLMCRVLSELGYNEGVEIFQDMTKHYA